MKLNFYVQKKILTKTGSHEPNHGNSYRKYNTKVWKQSLTVLKLTEHMLSGIK